MLFKALHSILHLSILKFYFLAFLILRLKQLYSFHILLKSTIKPLFPLSSVSTIYHFFQQKYFQLFPIVILLQLWEYDFLVHFDSHYPNFIIHLSLPQFTSLLIFILIFVRYLYFRYLFRNLSKYHASIKTLELIFHCQKKRYLYD